MIRQKPHQPYENIDKEYQLYYLHNKRMLRKYNIKIDMTDINKRKNIKYIKRQKR